MMPSQGEDTMNTDRIGRAEARRLAEDEFRRFAELTASLTPGEWAMSTDCTSASSNCESPDAAILLLFAYPALAQSRHALRITLEHLLCGRARLIEQIRVANQVRYA